MATHTNTQIRRDPRLRSVQVLRCESITPQMRRITLSGNELAGFQSDAPDDHVKGASKNPSNLPSLT